MGRKNCLPRKYDFFIIGEQLRCQMTSVGLIKDNRYHLRKHRQCFVAKDAIDWILKMHHVDTRAEAMEAMAVLQEFKVIHHVTDDQEFKDKNLLFRFTKDDETYKTDRDLHTFYRALEIYDKIKQKGKDVLRNVYWKGHLQTNVFYGEDLVDFLLEWEDTLDRDDVIDELKDLLNRDVFKQFSEDCHFVDDKIVYAFNIDFYKSCLLHEVLDIIEMFNTIPRSFKSPTSFSAAEDDWIGLDGSDSDSSDLPTPPVTKSGDPLSNDQGKRVYQIFCDKVGFGMTVRGKAPCYIHRIEPLGPAAKARLQVGQAVISVNGHSVHHMDHKTVGLLIAQCQSGKAALNLGVNRQKREIK